MTIYRFTVRVISRVGLSLICCLFVAGVLGVSCGKKETVKSQPSIEIDTTNYVDWLTYSKGKITIHYPPFHPQEGTMEDVTDYFSDAISRGYRFFRIPEPDDSVIVYYYSGAGQAQEMTGQIYPFSKDGEIHFFLPSYYGPVIMQYLIEKWEPNEPRYGFLKHGIISLLDYSGQDYHLWTTNYYGTDSFITLIDLANDTTVNSNKERYQSAEAASFVDYFVYDFGSDALGALYRSTAPFDEAVLAMFGITVDSLESRWIKLIGEVVEKKKSKNDLQPDSADRRR